MTDEKATVDTEELAPSTEEAKQDEGLAPQEQEQAAAATESAPEEVKLSDKAQERINKVTGEKFRAINRAEVAEAEIDRIKAEQSAPVLVGSEPKLEDPDIDYDEDKLRLKTAAYNKRVIDNGIQTGLQAAQTEAAQRRSQQDSDRLQATYTQKAEVFSKANADYEDTAQAALSALQDPSARMAILKSENGPEILYHLGKNLDKADDINSLGGVDAVMEIATLRAKLAPPGKKQTNAPEPIVDGLAGGGGGSKDDFDVKYPNAEFV